MPYSPYHPAPALRSSTIPPCTLLQSLPVEFTVLQYIGRLSTADLSTRLGCGKR